MSRNWVKDLQNTVETGNEMAEQGLISLDQIEEVDRVRENFSAKIPPEYLAAIKTCDGSDPIWRTVVPTAEELNVAPEELFDPIGDESYTPVRGITHRYPDRLLLKVTHTCAVYCRFCFRRYAVSEPTNNLNGSELEEAFQYIESHPEVWEVILTGGDPLVLSDNRLDEILTRLRSIEHIKVIRFHTRVPVVLPSRITPELAQILRGPKPRTATVYVTTHINHVQEITESVEDALETLADHGIPLLNQNPLLKGVNDTPEALEALYRKLIECRVKPYYLHHGDYAMGTAHFRTTIQEGQAIMRKLRGRMSGICHPIYVLDIPGGFGKVPVGHNYLSENEDHSWVVEDIYGNHHQYPPQVAKVGITE